MRDSSRIVQLATCVKRSFSVILKAMEVHFTPEQEAQLAQMATKVGTDPERLVKDVLVRYLDDEARFLAAVEKGIAAAERREFIEEEEMDARIERMFKGGCSGLRPMVMGLPLCFPTLSSPLSLRQPK